MKMVALRGNNTSVNCLTHTCGNHGSRGTSTVIDMQHNMQSSMRVQQPMQPVQHLNHNSVNLQPLNNVPYQYMPQNNSNCPKHDQQAARYHGPNCTLSSSHHYRLMGQTRE